MSRGMLLFLLSPGFQRTHSCYYGFENHDSALLETRQVVCGKDFDEAFERAMFSKWQK